MDQSFSQHFNHNSQLMLQPIYLDEAQYLSTVPYLSQYSQQQPLLIQPTHASTLFTTPQLPHQNPFPHTYHNNFQLPQTFARNPYISSTQQNILPPQPTYYGIPQYPEQSSSLQPQTNPSLEARIIEFMNDTRNSFQQMEAQIIQLSKKINEQCEITSEFSMMMALERERKLKAVDTQKEQLQFAQIAVVEATVDPEEAALLCAEDFNSIDAEGTKADKVLPPENCLAPPAEVANVVSTCDGDPPISPSMEIAIQVLMSGFPPSNVHSPNFSLPPPPAPFEISIPPIVYHRRGGRKTSPENPLKKTPTKRKAPRTARTKRAPKGKNKLPS